jgi:hypothetical protein
VVSSASSPWSACISVGLSEVKKFRVGTSVFDCNWDSLTPVVDVVDFLAPLSASSVGFRFRLLCLRNSSMDGGAVIVVLAVSPWRRCVWGKPSSRAASLCTLHTGRYASWRYLLVSAMFWTIRVHFVLSTTDARVHPARRAIMASIPHTGSMTAPVSGCCMVFSYSNLRDSVTFDLSFWNSGVGT